MTKWCVIQNIVLLFVVAGLFYVTRVWWIFLLLLLFNVPGEKDA